MVGVPRALAIVVTSAVLRITPPTTVTSINLHHVASLGSATRAALLEHHLSSSRADWHFAHFHDTR